MAPNPPPASSPLLVRAALALAAIMMVILDAAVYAYTRAAAAARFFLGSLTFASVIDHLTGHVERLLPMAALLLPARRRKTSD
jgi:hypothetical protein